MDQSPQPEQSGRKGAFPRLRDMSHATVRRLSRPLSMISGRSVSPTPEQTPHHNNNSNNNNKNHHHHHTTNKLRRLSTRNSAASRTSRPERPASMRSSRRTSLLSTGASSAVSRDVDHTREHDHKHDHDHDQEPLGELPVFGVSQRAYLASLVSLFSTGNGTGRSTISTPLSANTPITDPSSSGAASLGLYEYDIDSSAVYQYSKVRRLYVGWPGLVNPPPEALLEFEMETLPLLERDLQGISGHLGQQGIRITYELRMSGYASATARSVALAPTVWILYRAYSAVGTRVSVAELHQAVADIFYLQKGLEIQEGGGRIELTSDRRLVNVGRPDSKDSIKLSDGGKLSIHIEDSQEKYSVCGALCCVTIEEENIGGGGGEDGDGDGHVDYNNGNNDDNATRQIQSLCRIGGLLKINGKYILGVSTAHAMLDGSGIFRDSFDESLESRLPPGHAVDRDEVLSETSRIAKWNNVTRDAAVDFLGISMNSRGEMAINRSKPENATDFALLRLSKMPGYVRNKYIPPRAQEPVTITSTASASAAAMDEGPVYIICGGGDVADGQLVWGSACFIVRGRNFRVRRIQTARPLSAGITGAWVVRGEVLYGVIIAVYENEPFALMMTVERLFASILSSAFSIRSVELWDGEVPEALLQRVKEKGGSSKPTKNTSSGTSARRRATTETRDARNGAPPSKDIEVINGGGAAVSRPRNKSEASRPSKNDFLRNVENGTQTEEPCPPPSSSNAAAITERPITTSTEAPPSPGSTRRRSPQEARSELRAPSEASMSGAVQDSASASASASASLPPASKVKQRTGTGDSAVSTGARTTYTTASETLQRQDSGFDSAAAPAPHTPPSISNNINSNNNNNNNNNTDNDTPRRGLQAPPIRPAGNSSSNSSSRKVTVRGGVQAGEGKTGGTADDDDDASTRDADKTPTKAPTHSRRSSLHSVFSKTFRPATGKAPSAKDEKHDNRVLSATSIDEKRSSFFRRRRSSLIDPTMASLPRDDSPLASNAAPNLLRSDERPPSTNRRGPMAKTQQAEEKKDSAKKKNNNNKNNNNNYGIPPGGLNDRRPLSLIRRTSANKTAPEPGQEAPNKQDSNSTTGSGSLRERPLIPVRRSKGKGTEEGQGQLSKDNNFGIPPKGL